MPTTYQAPDPDDQVHELLAEVMRDHRPELADLGVRVAVLLAAADGEAPALKVKGHKVAARIRVVPLMYRALGVADALVEIDGDHWRALFDAPRRALLHHELCHLEIVTDPDTERPARDDLGRPRLKLTPGDVDAGDAFRAVIQAWGDDAGEYRNYERAYGFAKAAAGDHAGAR